MQWEFISKYKHPFNALIIADSHILSTKGSKANLRDLLHNLLPEKLKVDFDLTILADRDNKGKPSDLVQVRDEILEYLKKYNYNINLTIVLSKIHDRNFITNYLWCNSGYGFELINDDGLSIRNTHLTLFPITYDSKNLQVEKLDRNDEIPFFQLALWNEYKKVISETAETMGLYTNVIGSRKNRILN